MEIQKTNASNTGAVKSAFRGATLAVAIVLTPVPAIHPDNIQAYNFSISDAQKLAQSAESRKNVPKPSPHGEVSIGPSESFKLSSDRKKLSYTFKDENKDVSHVLMATSKDSKSNTIYGFAIYVDFSLGFMNMRAFNVAARDDVASVTIDLSTIAKAGDMITIDISYSKAKSTDNDSVFMSIHNLSAAKRGYTAKLDIPFGSIESYHAERIELGKKKMHTPGHKHKHNEQPQQHINPLKEAMTYKPGVGEFTVAMRS